MHLSKSTNPDLCIWPLGLSVKGSHSFTQIIDIKSSLGWWILIISLKFFETTGRWTTILNWILLTGSFNLTAGSKEPSIRGEVHFKIGLQIITWLILNMAPLSSKLNWDYSLGKRKVWNQCWWPQHIISLLLALYCPQTW